MVHNKQWSVITLLFGLGTALFARDAAFEGDNYSLHVTYNETVRPGDPFFVRMTLTRAERQITGTAGETTARLAFTDKNATAFYPVTPRRGAKYDVNSYVELLAALPLSTWQKTGAYTLTLTCEPFGAKTMKYELPLTVISKKFESETLKMGANATSLVFNNSPERIRQSDRLNKTVVTIDNAGVYQQTAFTRPTGSKQITLGFGERLVYQYSNGKKSTSEHYGIDFDMHTGTPVYACASGKVVIAENRIVTGWSVLIEHLPGLYSLYYHQDSLLVKEGDVVKERDQIGLSGATGFVTGPHLHWEMRLNGVAVNPDFFTTDFAFFISKPVL
jgi:hypothetical protein